MKGLFIVPPEKISKLQEAIAGIPLHGRVPVWQLASIVGQIISMSLAVGPLTRLRSRQMYEVLKYRRSWNDRDPLSDRASSDELLFWKDSVSKSNGQPIWFSPGGIL